jgi:hypothetical protein
MESYEAMRYIQEIRRQIGYNYPYSSGSATINCKHFTKDILNEVINYFLKREYHISINYQKNQITIVGYSKEY